MGKSLSFPVMDHAFICHCRFLLFLLDEWRRYLLNRINQIQIVCCADDHLNAIDGFLTIDNLLSIFRRSTIQCTMDDVADMFRKVIQTGNSTQEESLSSRIVKFVIPFLTSGMISLK